MTPTYHVVSHSHWDREWYKTFEQFRSMLVAMVDDLLALLSHDPRFASFTLDGQTVVVDDYLEVRPEREAELRALVEQGRLILGPWYVLPDEFLVSAEATVRNLLHGLRRSREFGGRMDVGYIPDSFGHIAMMPAILNGFGINAAMIYRGFGGEPGQDSSEYWWTSPDGSRCLMIHLFKDGYSGGYFTQERDEQILQRFRVVKDMLDTRAQTSHRLLMNGGDHHWPDARLPDALDLLRRHFDGNFVHSSVPQYVKAVRQEVRELPGVQGELRFGYRYAFAVLGGIYSSRIYLKQANWRSQNLLQRYAEPLNAWAVARGMRSQLPLVRHAWKKLMQNHPHDSICGCSIDPVHREMMTRFTNVEDVGTSVVDSALEHLIPYDDQATGDDRFLFFFNPSPFTRSDVAGATLHFYLQDIVVGLNPDVKVAAKLPPVRGFTLHDASGKEVPFQVVTREEGYDITYTRYNYPKQTYADTFSILVEANQVPAMGFAGLEVRKAKRLPVYRSSSLKTGRRSIENGFLRVDVNARGEVRITDKARKKSHGGLLVFEDTGDVGDEYNYSYPRHDRRVDSTDWKVSVKCAEHGPLRATLRITAEMEVPASATPDRRKRARATVPLPVTTTLSLTPHARHVEVVTTVENRAKDHRFRVLLPTGIRTRSVLADSQFCLVERERKNYNFKEFTIEHPAGVEPMQRFVTLHDGRDAFTLFSYGIPEYELLPDGEGTLALTLLRCVGLLAGEDLITRPGGKAGWHNETPDAQCPGTHTFRYALMPHDVDDLWTLEVLNRESEKFHLPLLPVRRKNSADLPRTDSFISISSSQLVLSAVKEAEDGTGDLIVRVYNASAAHAAGMLTCAVEITRAHAARLDETAEGELPVEERHGVMLNVAPRAIMTVRMRR